MITIHVGYDSRNGDSLIPTAAWVFPRYYLDVKYHCLAGCGYHVLAEAT